MSAIPRNAASGMFSTRRGSDWTAERVARLGADELQQLRENALRLGATQVVELCDAALNARPKSARRGSNVPRKRAQRLVSRSSAFQARGVHLPETGNGWCGERKADGTVVMSLWAPAVVAAKGVCSVLLWAPDADGAQPWSDTAAGQARLRHCRLALERGGGEGLLVYGENFDGQPVEQNARSVHGVDPERVVRFKVEQRGREFWAVWGEKNLPAPL